MPRLRPEDVNDAMLAPLSNAYLSTDTATYGQQLVAGIYNAVIAERPEPAVGLTEAERYAIEQAMEVMNVETLSLHEEGCERGAKMSARSAACLHELLDRTATPEGVEDE